MQDRYIDAWKHVAARYANEPTIAAYDIFNEPPRGGILTTQEMSSYLYSFYESLIHEIREIDKNRIIIYENVIGVDTQYAQLLNYPNLIFSFHYYEYAQYGRAPPYDYTASFGDLENYLLDWYLSKPSNNPVEDWNIPIWVGEFGSGIEAWVRDTTSLWNKYGLGWTWWIYWKSDEKSHALLYSNGTEREHLTKYLKQT